MRISDWSSDVCSSDLPKGARRSPSQKTAFLHYSYMVRFWKSTNQGAEPMPQEILPPPPAVVAPGAEPAPNPAINPALDPHHHPPALPFPPAPHRNQPWTGLTPPKHPAFLAPTTGTTHAQPPDTHAQLDCRLLLGKPTNT